MPIGFIASIGNFVQNLLWRFGRILIKHPQYLIPLIAIILFFPLELVDMLIYFIVNLFILIVNTIVFLVIIPNAVIAMFNLFIGYINSMLYSILDDALWEIIPGDQPTITLPDIPDIPYFSLNYYNINFFGPGGMIPFKCFFTLILGLFGITTTPIW